MKRAERIELGKRRVLNILRAQTVACDRTLEQKISDAGPNPVRVEPSVLTESRKSLVREGAIVVERRGKVSWYYVKGTRKEVVEGRLALLEPLQRQTQEGMFKHRLGQTLEIAVMKAIQRSGLNFLGHFSDLNAHDDSKAYTRVEPPMDISGKRMEKGPLDYVVFPLGECVAIEVKNYRTWLYPRSREVREMLWKCGDIDAIPVLVARRLPFITIRLLQMGGCLVHENYNQLYPSADAKLAEQVRNKNLLGYHDVRAGNEPDARMVRFMEKLLPELVKKARPAFEKFREAHRQYGKGTLSYREWVKRLQEGNPKWGPAVREEARAEAKGEEGDGGVA